MPGDFVNLLSKKPQAEASGEQIEAGVKFQSACERMMVTAAVFEIEKQNVTTPDPSKRVRSPLAGRRCLLE